MGGTVTMDAKDVGMTQDDGHGRPLPIDSIRLAHSIRRIAIRYGLDSPGWAEDMLGDAAVNPYLYAPRELFPIMVETKRECGPGPWDLWVSPYSLDYAIGSRERPPWAETVTVTDRVTSVEFHRLTAQRLARLRELWAGNMDCEAAINLREAIQKYMPEL